MQDCFESTQLRPTLRPPQSSGFMRFIHCLTAFLIVAAPAAARATDPIDAAEAQAVRAARSNTVSFGQLVTLLGQAMVNDRSLSVGGGQACNSCHGPSAAPAAGVFPGAVASRTGPRAPLPLTYAAYAPVLTWHPATRDFVGGNFWDSRATGSATGNPAADQAAVPLTSPFEMAMPDPACTLWRVSLAPYGALFTKVWGTPAVAWPADVARVCAHPNDGGRGQAPLHLAPADRARATLGVRQIAQNIEAFEASALASPFTSKFDAMLYGTAAFTPAEQRGYALFTGRAKCAACHDATGPAPLFTNFTSANIGVPRNPALPFLTETAADQGYVANPLGPAFVDEGLGGFLASPADTNPQWRAQAARFMGAFQVPTLRNVALRHAFMHNGAFTDLATVVHFLNTRDVQPGWPPPEERRNVNTTLTGNLGLSAADERDLVAFLGTLNDRP
jgi:cytochrome c peroxidase